jgi:hypothetical protein
MTAVRQLMERNGGELKPPSYGEPQRNAIDSVVDGIVGDLCKKIGDLRKTLDDIEQQVLEGAAGAKRVLLDHILVCVRVNDEIVHMQDVVKEIGNTVPVIDDRS